jgi:acetylglutamate kinase
MGMRLPAPERAIGVPETRDTNRIEDATRKAKVLIEALPFLKSFHSQIMVVKLGGDAIEDPQVLDALLTDLVWLEQVGVCPVLVHGGGKSISRAMSEAGITPVFHQGRRYTDERSITIVAREVERLNQHLVSRIFALGGTALGLCPPRQALVRGEILDPALGLVGRPLAIERELLTRCTSRGVIPVIPPLTIDASGRILNTNADDVSLAVASGISAEKLFFLSSAQGILADAKDPASLLSSLDEHELRRLITQGVITDGMIPKAESCIAALHAGVRKIHIVGAAMPHALLLEIFTDEGIGTELHLAVPAHSQHA